MTVTALVVDDNRELAENIGEILEGEGYEVFVAEDADNALKQARAHPFDVAVMDIRMPGMDGVSLHRKLLELCPDATYVLMTAYTRDARIAEALRAGVKEVLAKPLSLDALLQLLPPEHEPDEILIVEDERPLVQSLIELFQDDGYRALSAHTIGEARRTLREHPSLVAAIVDVRLPDGDGAALAREICTEHPGPEVFIITGYEPTDTVARAQRECPANCHLLTKPFSPDALLEAVEHTHRSRTRPS